MPPLLGTIMTIDAAGRHPTTASNSVLDENMTWSRPTGGSSTSSANEAHAIDTAILTDDHHHHRRIRLGSTTTLHVDRATTTIHPTTDPSTDEETSDYTSDPIAPLPTDLSTTEGGAGGGREDCACGKEDPIGGLPFLVEDFGNASVGGSSSTRLGGETSTRGVGGGSTSTDREDVEGLRELEVLFGLNGIMEDLDGSFNDSLNESRLLFPCNGSLCNETYVVLGGSLYPSGYTILQIVLASVLVTLLMIVIVVGNMLVIIAIATEKALKNIQNWFIASLAVADFFLGLVIMPFSLANEIMGYWIFGYWWCDIHSAMDVLLCTASIMNLCLISLDRYWSITQAVDYLKKRTPARAALMIALVWLLSALVCIPPLLGWKRPTPAEEYPKCKVSDSFFQISGVGNIYKCIHRLFLIFLHR